LSKHRSTAIALASRSVDPREISEELCAFAWSKTWRRADWNR
jgi:hypothetical protein